MSFKNLEEKMRAAGGPVELARNSQIGPYVYPKVPSEFTNWRDEQVAWAETCALFDQSHHMTELYLEGPDLIRLLEAVGVNSMANFAVNKAKQLVVCNPDGYVIGDGIVFYLDTDKMVLVGRPSAHNWVQYHAETGGYDVKCERSPQGLPLPGPGPDRDGGHGEGPRRSGARDQVLQHGRHHDRRAHCARSPSRHVGRAWP